MNQKDLQVRIYYIYYQFIDIRLYLIEPKKNKFLIKTLYGILFILPQGKLYNSLYERIKHIEVISSIDFQTLKEEKKKYDIFNIIYNYFL